MVIPRNARGRAQAGRGSFDPSDPFNFRARSKASNDEGPFGPMPSAPAEEEPRRRTTRTPLGVPDDYRVAGIKPESFRGMSPRAAEGWASQGQGPMDLREIGPRYYDGDQYRPAQYPVERIIDMQRRLTIAGFLDPGDIRLGSWTGATVKAYEELLGYANQIGLDADAALYHAAQAGPAAFGEDGSGSGGGGGYTIDPETGELVPASEMFVPPALEIRTTNKDDLRRVFRQATSELTGVGWSPDQIERMVQAYNQQEVQVQRDAYNQEVEIMRQEFAGTSPGGQEYTPSSAAREVNMPSPDTFLENQVREQDLEGYQANQVATQFMPAFFDVVSGYF